MAAVPGGQGQTEEPSRFQVQFAVPGKDSSHRHTAEQLLDARTSAGHQWQGLHTIHSCYHGNAQARGTIGKPAFPSGILTPRLLLTTKKHCTPDVQLHNPKTSSLGS